MSFWKRKEEPKELFMVPEDAKPVTWDAAVNGSERNLFTGRSRNVAFCKKCGIIYQQGGMVSEAVDAYPLYALTNGYRIESDNPRLAEDVTKWLETWDFEGVVHRLIIDALVYGLAVQEIMPTRGGGVHSVKPCPSWTWEIVKDEFGRPIKYRQYKDETFVTKYQDIDPNVLVVFEWQWLLQRAYDDIEIGRAHV